MFKIIIEMIKIFMFVFGSFFGVSYFVMNDTFEVSLNFSETPISIGRNVKVDENDYINGVITKEIFECVNEKKLTLEE